MVRLLCTVSLQPASLHRNPVGEILMKCRRYSATSAGTIISTYTLERVNVSNSLLSEAVVVRRIRAAVSWLDTACHTRSNQRWFAAVCQTISLRSLCHQRRYVKLCSCRTFWNQGNLKFFILIYLTTTVFLQALNVTYSHIWLIANTLLNFEL